MDEHVHYRLLLFFLLFFPYLFFYLQKLPEKLREEIKYINQNNLFKRIKVESMNEVGDLSESFNFMLDKIEGAFNNQKQFSANASHELRTPLASIISNIEVLEMDDEPSEEDYKKTIDIIKG